MYSVAQDRRIKVKREYRTKDFCYDRYTHTHGGIENESKKNGSGFRLGNIHYGGVNSKGEGSEQGGDSTCIKLNGAGGGGANGKCISASHDKNGGLKCGAFPVVVVFYYKGDKNHEHPLLVALRSPDPGWDNKHKPYFELTKKFDPGQQKKYTKNKNGNGIDLGNTSPDGELAQKLDTILYTISKKLQIVLNRGHYQNYIIPPSNTPQRRDLSTKNFVLLIDLSRSLESDPAKPELQSTLHHVLTKTSYRAQLYEPKGQVCLEPRFGTTDVTVYEV
nr:hypothetical protein MACL_00003324 [Theileria orientalis]